VVAVVVAVEAVEEVVAEEAVEAAAATTMVRIAGLAGVILHRQPRLNATSGRQPLAEEGRVRVDRSRGPLIQTTRWVR
jgi:hypothetical protein